MTAHGQRGQGLGGRASGAALVVLGLLVFTWPFVRMPPLGLLGSYLHLLGAWLLVIAGTAATAKALGRGPGDD
jgi:hypothetical protein